MARSIEDFGSVDCFHPRQIWQSPRGIYYRVLEVTVGGKARLGQGKDGWGKKIARDWDAVLDGWALHQDAVAQEYTARLYVPYPKEQREAFELTRDRDDYTEGFVSICYRTRRFALGLVDPANRHFVQPGPVYEGRRWKEEIRRDALEALCKGVDISSEQVRVVTTMGQEEIE